MPVILIINFLQTDNAGPFNQGSVIADFRTFTTISFKLAGDLLMISRRLAGDENIDKIYWENNFNIFT